MLRTLWPTLIALLALGGCTTDPAPAAPPPPPVEAGPLTGGDTTARALSLEFTERQLPERHYLVFRQRLPLLDMNGFLAMEARTLGAAAGAKNIEPNGPATALFYEWDVERGVGEAAVALPVAAGTTLPPYVTIVLPATRALSATLNGPYDGLGAVHYALESELRRRGLSPATPSIEEYLVGPAQGATPENFVTRVTYPTR